MLPDLLRRVELTEQMDGDCSYAEFRAALLDLRKINGLLLGYRPTLAWLSSLPRGREPLHLLDIGSGGGEMLRTIERWAGRRGLALQLTGIDLNPYASRVARESTPEGSRITWLQGDAFSAPVEKVDLVISSLLTHHLSDGELVRFLGWMEANARVGWFINDLQRSAAAYRGYRLLCQVAGWKSFVVEDGLTSIRRSFRREEWLRYLELAGIDAEQVKIEHWNPGRLCLRRVRA